MILGLIVLSWIVVSVPLGIVVGRCMALKDQAPESKAKSRTRALPLRRSA
jgi:hypothetical protein